MPADHNDPDQLARLVGDVARRLGHDTDATVSAAAFLRAWVDAPRADIPDDEGQRAAYDEGYALRAAELPRLLDRGHWADLDDGVTRARADVAHGRRDLAWGLGVLAATEDAARAVGTETAPPPVLAPVVRDHVADPPDDDGGPW